MDEQVIVRKAKWDGSTSDRTPARLIACRAGRIVWVVADSAGGQSETTFAARAGHWWVAAFERCRDSVALAIDISLPVQVAPGRLSFLDLDLDLVGRSPETLNLEDLGQFQERTATMGYPDWVRLGAWRGLADAHRFTRERRWPFDGSLP